MGDISFEKELNHYQKIVDKELQNFFNKLKFSKEKNPLVRKEIELLKKY